MKKGYIPKSWSISINSRNLIYQRIKGSTIATLKGLFRSHAISLLAFTILRACFKAIILIVIKGVIILIIKIY